MKDLKALILCGGYSTRMGTDKGLIQENGVPWARRIEQQFAKVGIQTYFSIRQDQEQAYSKWIEPELFVYDEVFDHINGALRGMLTAHKLYTKCDWFISSCDIKDLESDLIAYLVNWQEKVDSNFVIPRSDGFLHPLCAIYSANGLDQLYHDYMNDLLKNQSMVSLLLNRNAALIDVPEAMRYELNNFNSPEDLIYDNLTAH